jgi:hypothetical protein
MNTLYNIEKKFKSLVEDKIVNIFSHTKYEDLISRKLASAMYEQVQTLENGTIQAPNFFLLITSPEIGSEIRKNENFLKDIAKGLGVIGQEAGFTYLSRILISNHEDNTMKKNNVKVIASLFKDREDETQGLKINSENKLGEKQGHVPSYLIIEGKFTVTLEGRVVNLGRRPENQIVLEDLRVSRDHAQIREINGKYKIFDLNSKGGTFINERQISQSFLKSGDVISLAGSTMIFIQEEIEERDETEDTIPSAP